MSRARVDLAAGRLLGRDVLARPEHRPGLRQARLARRSIARSRSRSPSRRRCRAGRSAASRRDGRAPARGRTRARARSRFRARARRAPAAAPCSSTSCLRFSPSTYSKTMNWRPPASPRSITVTMFGCESLRRRPRLAPEPLDVVVVARVVLVQHLDRDRGARAAGRAHGRHSTCRRCRRAPRARTDPRSPRRPFGGFSLRRRAYAPMPTTAGLAEDVLERLLPDPECLRPAPRPRSSAGRARERRWSRSRR